MALEFKNNYVLFLIYNNDFFNLTLKRFGDFERTFSKVYFQNYPTFVNALKTSSKFRIKNFFFYLQFGKKKNNYI